MNAFVGQHFLLKLSDLGEFNADSKGDGLTVDDAVAIQKRLAGVAE